MALIRSRNLWVLALCAGGVLAAAAVVGGLALREEGSSLPVPEAISPKGDYDYGCGWLTSVAVEGASAAPGGWSYFGTGAAVSLGGTVTYFCYGRPFQGYGPPPETHFWAGVTCDGSPLNVNYQDVVVDHWIASFTAPSAESVCSLELRADVSGGVSAVVNETLVFMADTGLRPMVTLTSPQAGVVVYPDTIKLSADASVSPPASITKVEFFDSPSATSANQVRLGEVALPPYSIPDVLFDPADHWIYAVATDSRGYKVMSPRTHVVSKFNVAPVIHLRSPTVGADYAYPGVVSIIADVSDLDNPPGPLHGLRRVSLFGSGILLNEVIWPTGPSSEAVTFDWQPNKAGVNTVFVEAEDQRGAIRRIGPVTITLTPDAAPTVKLSTPVDGLFQAPGIVIPLSASASDDRSISQIDFTIAPWPGTTGAVVLGASVPTASSLLRDTWTATATWTPTVAGRYVIRARARDGATRPDVSSDPIEVYIDDSSTVNFVPKVRIELPVNGDGVRQNTTMPVTVRAQDGFGESGITLGIKQLSLYLDGAAIGSRIALTSATSNGITIWTGSSSLSIGALPSGTHTLRARATDASPGSLRADSESPPVTFTVLGVGVDPAPEGSLSLPVGTSQLGVGAATTLSVKARDINVDGSISKIEIFANGERISPVTPPLPLNPVASRLNEATATMSWTPADSGDYDLFARVTDNANLVSDSPLLKVRVAAVAGNPAPNIVFTQPENGSYFEIVPGGWVTLRTQVSDPGAGGTGAAGIVSVDFFDGTTRIGTESSGFPIGTAQTTAAMNWFNPPEGAHALTARARDAQGSVTISAPINLFMLGGPPQISILPPQPGPAGFIAPESILVSVVVSDDYGIDKVEFFLDGSPVGESGDEPFAFQYTNLGAGTHVLTARATDFGGHATLSAPVNINVAVNQLPTIAITSPITTSPLGQFGEGNDIPIQVSVNDPDEGQIRLVEYLRNGAVILSSSQPPFNVTWRNASPAGLANLTARVTDIRDGVGATATTTVVNVVAARPPLLSFSTPTLPGAGNTIFAGEQVGLSALASDPDATFGGQITHVDFFRSHTAPDGQLLRVLISSDTTAPYAATWVATSVEGSYTFSVEAYDSGPVPRNVTTASSPLVVEVRALNHAPISVRFHPYSLFTDPNTVQIWPTNWGPWVAFPAMPSNFRGSGNFDRNPPYQVQANGRLRLCAIADDVDGSDAYGNLAGMRFYLSKPGVASDLLLGTASTRSASISTPYCSWRKRVNGVDQIDYGYTIEVDLDGAHASTDVQFIRAEAFDSRGLTATTAVNPDAEQTGYIPCVGDAYRESDYRSQGSVCSKFSVPIAIINPAATTSPCGMSGNFACADSRFLLPLADNPPTTLQAERYDLGGQGLAMFEKNYVPTLSPRGDHVALACPGTTLEPSCTLTGFDNGEYRRYSVTMPSDGTVIYTVRYQPPQPRVWLESPANDIYLDLGANNIFKDVEIRALVSGYAIGSGAHSTVKVEFFRRHLVTGDVSLIQTSGPDHSRSHLAYWHPDNPEDWEIGARATVAFDPDGTGTAPPVTLVGDYSEWRTVHWVNTLPAGVVAPEPLALPTPTIEVAESKEPGFFEGRAPDTACVVLETRLELDPSGTATGWFLQDSCPVGLPTNDYYFNLTSDVDGEIVDSINFSTISAGTQVVSVGVAAPAQNEHFAVGASIGLRAEFVGVTNVSTVRYEISQLHPITFDVVPGTTERIDVTGAYPDFLGTWTTSVQAPYQIQAFGKPQSNLAEVVSVPVRFFVDAAISNPPPQVSLTNPSTDLTITVGSAMQLTMTATDNGQIQFDSPKFLLIKDGIAQAPLGATGSGGSYSASWTPEAGSYSVTAQASDTQGLVGTSSSHVVAVLTNPAPQVSLTNPLTDISMPLGSSLPLMMTASDNGQIQPGSTLFMLNKDGAPQSPLSATANGSGYSAIWVPDAGTYTVTAQASDTFGMIGSSSPLRTVVVYAGTVSLETRYQYDALGRLTRVDHANGSFTNYFYDAAGNRTSQTQSLKSPQPSGAASQ